MNFELSEDQRLMRESFARFLDANSSSERVRAAAASGGHDPQLWSGLAELGAFMLRIPEADGGLGLGLLDACVLMEEVGRTLAAGPIAETLVAARVLAMLAVDSQAEVLDTVQSGQSVLTLAAEDIATAPRQWLAGGAVATLVVARRGDDVVLVVLPAAPGGEDNLASTPLAEVDLGAGDCVVLGTGDAAL